MSVIQQVTVSGSIGKQVVATTNQAILRGLTFTPSGANATIKIRDGNASGSVVFFARVLSAYGTQDLLNGLEPSGYRFSKGMHVKIIGANAEAYLVLD